MQNKFFIKKLKQEPISLVFLILGLAMSYVMISLTTSFSTEIYSMFTDKSKTTPPNAQILEIKNNTKEELKNEKISGTEIREIEEINDEKSGEILEEEKNFKRLTFDQLVSIFSSTKEKTGIMLNDALSTIADEDANVTYQASYEWFNSDDIWHYPLKEGRYYTSDEIKNDAKVVLIGEELMEYTKIEKNKKYLQVNGKKCEVIGVVGFKNKPSLWDSRLFLPLNMLPDGHMNGLLGGKATFMIHNPKKCTLENSEIIMDGFGKNGIDISVENQGEPPSESVALYVIANPNNLVLISVLGYILSLVYAVNIISLWMEKREYEMCVRKALGYSHKDIKRMIFKEIAVIASIAVVIGIIVQICLIAFFKSKFSFNIDLHISNIIVNIIIIALTAELTILWPYHRIKKLNPSEVI